MKFDLDEFRAFCSDLKIDTKEFGVVSLGKAWSGTQEYFIQQIADGLNDGIHYFVVLKGRQVHITTICLALDLYWSLKYSGMQGTLITDTEENREMFRETLTLYYESLPAKWKHPVVRHNRTQLIFKHRSRFMYQVAGTKKKTNRSVGVGKAVVMMHATECSNWGDDEALPDIGASLAKQNPKRLYIWESTARGYNGFTDLWETAQRSNVQKAIFVGWWRNSLYRCRKGSPEYTVYWDGTPTSEEVQWSDEVKQLYDFTIDDEQFAWWRYTMAEEQGSEAKMYENYPPTENYAFQMSGSQFFNSGHLGDRMKVARAKAHDSYRFVMGMSFGDTQVIDANEETATLKVWEHPQANSFYALGCDPAWGSSEWADRFCVQVFRCYADGMEQVAEFCTEHCNTDHYAWIMLYLAGYYSQAMINLEINGPGMAVWQEIQSLKRLASVSGMPDSVTRVLRDIQNHLYRRPDSIGGGFNYHTKTTLMEKERYLNTFRDHFERGLIVVNSIECMREMKNCVRTDGDLGAPGRGKDDRVISAGLAAIAWRDHIQLRLAYLGHTREKAVHAQARDALPDATAPLSRNIRRYLQNMGIDYEKRTAVH